MFWIDIDYRMGVNTVHRDMCVHSVPDNSSGKSVNSLGEDGGWLSFPSVGEAVRYLKANRIKGLTKYCEHCEPLNELRPEPRAALGLKSAPIGCSLGSNIKPPKKLQGIQITDTKTMARKLARKLFGNR